MASFIILKLNGIKSDATTPLRITCMQFILFTNVWNSYLGRRAQNINDNSVASNVKKVKNGTCH